MTEKDKEEFRAACARHEETCDLLMRHLAEHNNGAQKILVDKITQRIETKLEEITERIITVVESGLQ